MQILSNNVPWNKGKKGLQKAWNKGLTKKTDKRLSNVGVYERTEYHNNISRKNAKYNRTEFHREISRKNGLAIKGIKRKPYTEEHRKRLSEGHKGLRAWNKGLTKDDEKVKKYTEKVKEWRKNNPNFKPTLGKHWKIKDLTKIREASKKRIGKKKTLEARIKQGISQRGQKHWNWQGGKTTENKLLRRRIENDLWRNEIFGRDDYTCQECGIKGGKIQAHHIKAWSRYPELRFDINNGITLCEECHKKTDNYAGKLNKKT